MKRGFTLAEVLITLAIIGVVAALTIPVVVRNYQKTQVVTQLKKAYNALSNTTSLAMADYGPITEWDVKENNDGGAGKGSIEFANKYLIPYLKVSRDCENKTDGICRFDYTYLNKSSSSYLTASCARFYLNDGTFIAVQSRNYISGTPYKFALVYVDINGQKKPNTWGKDIFQFYYYIFFSTQSNQNNGKFMPRAYSYSVEQLTNNSSEYNCNKSATGERCAALIMKQGWQITEDYPWN